MVNKREILKAVGALPLAWWSTQPVAGYAQNLAYPTKPITLIAPYNAGNAGDIGARLLAQQLSSVLGQQVIVENRPGAGGVVGVKLLARAAPDGYTLLFIGAGVAISQALLKPKPYDMLKETVQVSTVSTDDVLILVRNDSKFKNLEDFIRDAEKRGGAMTVGISAMGTVQHMTAALFKSNAKLDYLIAPFGSHSALVTASVAGEVDAIFEYASPTSGLLTSGKVRPLAICSAKRSDFLPAVPTVAELGIPNCAVSPWTMVLAPARTPDPIVQRLNQGIQQALKTPAYVSQLKTMGLRVMTPGTASQAHDLMVSEVERWENVVSTLKIELK